jgi:NAD(P)-dependent dehydrogenase (short-subunit alcohol dehydrogenase family)
METQKVVLITGTSTGIGRLMAETCARRGYAVFASMRHSVGRNAAHSAALRTLAEAEDLSLHVVELDVTDGRVG